MTKCNMPVAYCGEPVQKLVTYSTVTNLASSSKPLNLLEVQGFSFFMCIVRTHPI